ncbi:MAG: peptidoglycan DD-metalloendopeptidase family protein [Baekduia sp.]
MRARTAMLCLALGLLVAGGWALAGAPRTGAAQSAKEIDRKIGATREKIGKRKGTERVLASDIARYNRRIGKLQGSISALQSRQSAIEEDLDARRTSLERTQRELRVQRARLTRLQAKLDRGKKVLAERLRELYQADKPDLVTVVLSSNGFADLIQRSEFLGRIQAQDTRVMTTVKSARLDAEETAARLDVLENRQRELTETVQKRRDEVATVKRRLINTRVGYDRTKAGKASALASVREDRKVLEKDLNKLIEQSNRIKGVLSAVSAGPIKQGSGRFIWPINGTLTSPFCESRSWENCHPGIDIAAPTGTPIRAADTGTVRIAGWVGGYGNYTCIQHTSTLSTCYGHQSAIGVSVGQAVSKGQVIGKVGSTGFSTGPHLHFEVRMNGAVQNPMRYL